MFGMGNVLSDQGLVVRFFMTIDTGIAVNIIIGICIKLLLLPELSWGISFLFFISLGIMGQMGDLFESGLKRVAGIKDSGGIFPGHGGILDRADATLFAAPVAYLFKEYIL